MIQAGGILFCLCPGPGCIQSMQFYSGKLDVKNLGFTPWSLFCNISYPLTPLFNGGFAIIWYPEWKGVYLGPSLDLSLKSNFDLSLILQYFTAEFETPQGSRAERIIPLDFSGLNGVFKDLR